MRSSVLIFLLLLCTQSLFSARFAFLVGNNRGGGNLAELKYVRNDLYEMKNVLTANCNFEIENISELYNGTPDELVLKLNSFAKKFQLTESDVFFFYYSGHANNQSLLMGDKQLSLTHLKSTLKQVISDVQIVVLDACQSGSFSRLKGGVIDTPFLFKQDDNIEGQVVLYSSSDNEFSQESDLFKHSIFTFHLINGLKGCADKSGDKKVTLNEAYQYSYNQTVTSTLNSAGGIQHPGYLFDIKGKGDVILSDMSNKNSGIILSQEVAGSIAILNSYNNIVADFHKKSDRQVFIALSPGKYKVYSNNGTKTSKAKVLVSGDATQYLQNTNFTESKAIPIYAKGAGKRTRRTPKITTNIQFGSAIKSHAALEGPLVYKYDFLPEGSEPFTLPFEKGAFTMGGGASITLPNGIFLRNQYTFYKYFGTHNYTGHQTIDGVTHENSISMDFNSTLSYVEVELSAGYRLQRGFLKNLAFACGINLLSPYYNSDILVEEKLFNMKSNLYDSHTETYFSPSASIGYSIALSKFFEFDIFAKYIIDIESQGTYSQEDYLDLMTPSYTYDNSGWFTSLAFNFILNGKKL